MLRGLAKTHPHRPLRASGPMVRVTLAPEVADALWTAAEVMSEGEVRTPLAPPDVECASAGDSGDATGAAPAERAYFGSTMITIPLDRLAGALGAESIEGPELRVLLELLGRSALVRAHVARVARREAKSRVPGGALGRALTETRMRVASGRLEIDIDIEAPVERIAGRRRPA